MKIFDVIKHDDIELIITENLIHCQPFGKVDITCFDRDIEKFPFGEHGYFYCLAIDLKNEELYMIYFGSIKNVDTENKEFVKLNYINNVNGNENGKNEYYDINRKFYEKSCDWTKFEVQKTDSSNFPGKEEGYIKYIKKEIKKFNEKI